MSAIVTAPKFAAPIGMLAKEYCDVRLPVQVLRSAAGYYIGTCSETDGPVSRESVEYYRSETMASDALTNGTWTQRDHP